jgi:uncharacterized protein
LLSEHVARSSVLKNKEPALGRRREKIKGGGYMKASNYVVYLHIPGTDDYYLVHGYSGAVDKVSPEVVKFMIDHADPAHTWHTKDQEIARQSLEGRELGEISSEGMEMLKKRGYLTAMSSEEERNYVSRLAGFLHDKKVSGTSPMFMFVPSYECNLRCPYCFETDTRVQLGKLKILQNVMTEREVDAAFKSMEMLVSDRFAARPEMIALQKKSITLYGGEPLMQETLPIIEYILEQGLARGYSFGAITNAVDLHNFLHLLGPEKINFLQITLDGPKDIHNRKRIGPRHKGGTYDRILENMKLALPTGVRISVRFHVDYNNIERTRDLTDELTREGFSEYENFNIYTYPIHMFHQGIDTPEYPLMAIHQMHKEIKKTYNKPDAEPAAQSQQDAWTGPDNNGSKSRELRVLLTDEGIQTKLKTYIKGQLLGLYKGNMEPCGATTGLYIFDPLGKIYTCWDSVGMAGHETGTYSMEGPVLNGMNRNWLSRSPATIEECKDCKYAFFHFGGCASLPVGSKGTIFAPACYDYQDNFIYSGQNFFKQGLERILDKPTVPPGIQEASAEAQAGMEAAGG